MTEDDLDELRAEVATGTRRGAGAHIRLAQALRSARKRDEAIAVLRAAIASGVSESAGELEIVAQESTMRDMLAELLHPRPKDLPYREWEWPACKGLWKQGRVYVATGALRWIYLGQGEPPTHSSGDQTFSSFVANGPPHPDVPEPILRELVAMLDAEREPWVAPYIEAFHRLAEATARRRAAPPDLNPTGPLPSFGTRHLARLVATMSAAEAERFDELRTAIASDVRAGWKYQWSYREEWSECSLSDGRLVWSDGYCDDPPKKTVLETDDDLIWRLIASGAADAASAIRSLEDAIPYVSVDVLPGADLPRIAGLPPPLRFETRENRCIRLAHYPSGAVKQGFLEPLFVWINGNRYHGEVALFPSGKLRAGRLRSLGETVRGVPCTGVVAFHESGGLRAAKLAADFTIQGTRLKGGQYVDFDEAERVTAGCLARTSRFVRFGHDGVAKPVLLPQLTKSSWQGGRMACRLLEQGAVFTSEPGPLDAVSPWRELLQGLYYEALLRELGPLAVDEILRNAALLYRAISECPLDFELTTGPA